MIRSAFLLPILAASLALAGCEQTHRVETVTVTNTDRVCDGGKHGTCKYLVYTTGTTYENVDAPFEGKQDSSDVQGHLLAGHTYQVDVVGWRNPNWSMYANILRIVREVPAPATNGTAA